MADRIVLVTGAAGFIGQAVAARLAGDGLSVRAGVRRAALPEALSRLDGVAPVPCDLDDASKIRAAAKGAHAVVHAAWGPDAELAPRFGRLLSAMAAEGVADLVHLSSIAVYGERTGRVSEADGPAGALGPYGEAKIACEALARGWAAAAPGRRALLLRPGAVYGRGSALWIDRMAERIRAGALGDLGAAAAGPAPLVHVDDLADAVRQALRRYAEGRAPELEGAVALNLVGPDGASWRRYFAALAESLGAAPLTPVGPNALALQRVGGPLAKVLKRLCLPAPRRFALAPARGELALFAREATYATGEAARRIGFTPRIGLEEGLSRSVGPAQAKS